MADRFARFPRELTDMVLTELVLLHNDEPAHQWTHLRLLSRHLKASVEQHFRDFWLPKLSFAISIYGLSNAEFIVFRLPQGKSARFEKREGDESREYVIFEADCDHKYMVTALGSDLATWLQRATRPALWLPWNHEYPDPIIVRLGEGTLNKGFTKGGIISNTIIPGIKINITSNPWELSFDWKSMFTWLLTEETLLQSFRDRLLQDFLPEIKTVRKWEARQVAIYGFLLRRYQIQRRSMLAAYRDHVARHTLSDAPRSLKSPAETFDMTPYVEQPKLRHPRALILDFDTAVLALGGDQSVVFQIPGWQTWSIHQLARMRILDEMIHDDVLPCGNFGADCVRYYADILVRQSKALKKSKEISDRTLDRYLRGPVTNLMLLWVSCDAQDTAACQNFRLAIDFLQKIALFAVVYFCVHLFRRSVLGTCCQQ